MVVGVAVLLLVATATGYLGIVAIQGGPPPDNFLTVPFVAGYLALMALLLAASLSGAAPIALMRPALRAAPAAGLMVLGVLAIFSIGLPVLIAPSLATAATVVTFVTQPARGAVVAAVVAGLISVAALLAGLEFTWHYVVCPPTGLTAGTTAGIFIPSYSYECSYGHLTINR